MLLGECLPLCNRHIALCGQKTGRALRKPCTSTQFMVFRTFRMLQHTNFSSYSSSLQKNNIAWFGLVIALLMVFLKNALMCIKKSKIN